jgi:hypothetical protein
MPKLPKCGVLAKKVVGTAPRPTTRLFRKTKAMTRTLIAMLVTTTAIFVCAFGVAMAVTYELNERCTDQMAQQGNC